MKQEYPDDLLKDIKLRLAAAYNPKQVLRIVLTGAIIFIAHGFFPNDFPYIHNNYVFLWVVYFLVVGTQGGFTWFLQHALNKAEDVSSLDKLLSKETLFSFLSLTLMALIFPIPNIYYVNINWFMSAFFFSFILDHPFLKPWMARSIVWSPFLGWMIHTLGFWLLRQQPPHVPALAFCAIMTSMLAYAHSFFVKSRLNSSLAGRTGSSQVLFYDRYGFSAREAEVMELILRGRITKEIAFDLSISDTTVKTHINNIFRKTGAHSRLELYALYNRDTLLPGSS